jgi:hypothetical protein
METRNLFEEKKGKFFQELEKRKQEQKKERKFILSIKIIVNIVLVCLFIVLYYVLYKKDVDFNIVFIAIFIAIMLVLNAYWHRKIIVGGIDYSGGLTLEKGDINDLVDIKKVLDIGTVIIYPGGVNGQLEYYQMTLIKGIKFGVELREELLYRCRNPWFQIFPDGDWRSQGSDPILCSGKIEITEFLADKKIYMLSSESNKGEKVPFLFSKEKEELNKLKSFIEEYMKLPTTS